MKEKISSFIVNPKYIFGVYIITAIATALSKYSRGERAYNNYLIFKNVFFNTLKERNLYLSYPEYLDVNHYGIFFSFIIAPFAMLPDWAGLVLWNIANVLVFLLAVKKLPFSERNKSFFLWLCLQEFITSSLHQQFNVALAGLIILSAAHIYRKEEVQSALSICIGFFVKIYGIVGLSSFFFIENKKKFILSFIGISLAFLTIPMLYSSVHFGLQSYVDWFVELKHKNMKNQQLGNFQDISLMGFVRRVLGNPAIPNMLFLAIGVPLFFLPYLRISQYKYLGFKLSVLASSLLFVVLFSSSSEPPTYIIAVAGAVIWFLIQEKKSPLVIGMLVFLILFTCFSTSDLFPKSVKDNFILKYSIKALPCIVIWFRLTWELLTKKYTDKLSY
ncbi:hypothetical protein DRF59_11390 [Chryseobacterium flavum]|uniref:DUF2029 domain-containing protein n=1 Tax=Chryseobacterium flavum TaxID=415851 RepID=A0A3D9CML3_9FLAO|nr:glycosyltransferase family 87 protein [Chryseobacterium flavum]REC66899.1 hypothetical protein DRF59_11390 [Chryseobacterium flavum]